VLASEAAPSASSPLHVVLAERERMLLQRRSIARGESGRLLERGESDAHGFGSSASAGGSSNHHDRVLGRDGKHALLDHADTFGGSRGSFSAHPLPVTLIYYAPEMADVAAELARGPAAPYVRLRRIDWGRFPDGWPNLFIHDIKDTRFHTVVFLASFHDQAALTTQLHVIYTLPSYARRLNVVIPWFPTGTMERISTIGEVPTAKTVASMLSATPTAAAGPPLFQILDVHALQTQFYFEAGVHVRLKSCVSLLVDRLLRLPDVANVRIAFPDDGAAKRFKDKFDAFGEPVICSKRREGDRRRIVISDGDPRGRHVVIVDDLVQSGSTLLECAHALEAHGATAISAYVTHAVFPRESWRKFAYPSPCPAGASTARPEKAEAAGSGAGGDAGLASAAGGSSVDAAIGVAEKATHHTATSSAALPPGTHAPQPSKGAGTPSAAVSPGLRMRHFWVTNSIPTTAAALRGVCPFEVLSIAPVIEDMLMGS
jgi:phosphoribosylpyrophosphate synthetase